MNDLISRRAAIDAVRATLLAWSYMPEWRDNKIIEAVERLPPIQPDIVRCKDCKYAEYIDDVKTLWCTECGQGRTVTPYDFCSYAVRREVTT